jgi:hypothetical protein
MGFHAREYALTRRWDLALSPLYDTYRDVARWPNREAVPLHHLA